jgi:hypothetical protein
LRLKDITAGEKKQHGIMIPELLLGGTPAAHIKYIKYTKDF